MGVFALHPRTYSEFIQYSSIDIKPIQEDAWGINLKIFRHSLNYIVIVYALRSYGKHFLMEIDEHYEKGLGMKAIKVFFLGLLCGWLYKWIIDQVYTDVQIQDITIEDPLPIVHSELPVAKEQSMQVNKALPPKTKTEILEVLKGIGPASVKRLNKAGVFTFDDLALLRPEELRAILGNVLKRAAISENQVIAEAKKFAEQKQIRSE